MMFGMMFLWPLLFIGLVVLVVWALAGGTLLAGSTAGRQAAAGRQPPAAAAQANSAREILRERYARGEIDREEYLAKLKDLA